MERFKLMTLVSTLMACAVSTSVMAKPAMELGGPDTGLEAHDWKNLCNSSAPGGCRPDCTTGTTKVACERIFKATGALELTGVGGINGLVSNGVAVWRWNAPLQIDPTNNRGPTISIPDNQDAMCMIFFDSGRHLMVRNNHGETYDSRHFSSNNNNTTLSDTYLFPRANNIPNTNFNLVCFGINGGSGPDFTRNTSVNGITAIWS